MRSARTNDYWRKSTRREYKNYIKDIDLQNFNGIGKIEFEKGIYAICGLNGAGKTTIISGIKDLLGIEKSRNDLLKIGKANISGHLVVNSEEIECSNTTNTNGVLSGLSREKVLIIDYNSAQTVMEFFTEQDNLEELLEQNDEIILEDSDLEEVSYLVGKEYSKIKIIEIDDMDDDNPRPFFEVSSHGITYDTRKMGLGEHFLIFLFWALSKIQGDSILILEEPETFIGIESQKHLMDYLAMITSDKGVSVIVTTHSPFILEKISSDHITILGRLSNRVNIIRPNMNLSVDNILGIKDSYRGTFWVEDSVAELFLTVILEKFAPYLLRKFSIIAVGSESEITKCLQWRYDKKIHYTFVGVYDGDMRGKIKDEDLNWKHTFLPTDDNVETELKKILYEGNNLKDFCDSLGRDTNEMGIMLSNIDGHNYHDWFLNLCRYISCDKMFIMRELSKMWIKDNENSVKDFIEELSRF